jgi:hypothetical protein
VPSSRLFSTSCTALLFTPVARTACARVVSSSQGDSLGTSAHPRSDTSGHLGGIESALTGAYSFFLVAAASTTVHCEIHAVSANHLNDFRSSGRSRAHSTSVHRPTATCQLRRGSALPLSLRLRNSTARGRSHTTTAHLSGVFASGCNHCAFTAFLLLKSRCHCLSDRRFWCDLVCLAPTYVPLHAVRQHYATLSRKTRSHVTCRFCSN